MDFDTSLSLEFVLTILAILGAIWRLEHKFDRKLTEHRQEFKDDNGAMRSELKADNIRLADKIDDCNQRLARLEGIILAREDLVGTIAEANQ